MDSNVDPSFRTESPSSEIFQCLVASKVFSMTLILEVLELAALPVLSFSKVVEEDEEEEEEEEDEEDGPCIGMSWAV